MTNKTKVLIIESEAGWGQKIDDVLEFDTPEEAILYCKDYNTTHNPPLADTPNWYMYAKLDGDNSYTMLRH
jgi:hypothetical protein